MKLGLKKLLFEEEKIQVRISKGMVINSCESSIKKNNNS